jgi:single-strand DNA-binding protein
MFLNKVFVLGNLTADPDVRSLPSGQSVVNFRIATNRVFYDKNKEKQEQVEFHNIVAFGRTAEIIEQYLKKGSLVLIEGRLQTRSWEDKSTGVKRFKTEIVTERMQMGPKRLTGTTFPTPPSSDTNKKPKPVSKEEIPIIEEEEEIDVKDIPF